jgi:hypothetical protein
MCRGQQTVVVSKAPHQLQANWQAVAAARKRQVNARQSEQGPATAKQGVTGGLQPCRRFPYGAWGQQHIVIAEQIGDDLALMCHRLQVFRVGFATDAHAVF